MNGDDADRTWTSDGRRIYGFPDWTIERRTDGVLHIFQGTKWFIAKGDPEELAFVREFAQALIEAADEEEGPVTYEAVAAEFAALDEQEQEAELHEARRVSLDPGAVDRDPAVLVRALRIVCAELDRKADLDSDT